MTSNIYAYERNPHVLKKLVRFTGYLPASLACDGKDYAIKIDDCKQTQVFRARDGGDIVDVIFKGNKYHAKISSILMADDKKSVDMVYLKVVS